MKTGKHVGIKRLFTGETVAIAIMAGGYQAREQPLNMAAGLAHIQRCKMQRGRLIIQAVG